MSITRSWGKPRDMPHSLKKSTGLPAWTAKQSAMRTQIQQGEGKQELYEVYLRSWCFSVPSAVVSRVFLQSY